MSDWVTAIPSSGAYGIGAGLAVASTIYFGGADARALQELLNTAASTLDQFERNSVSSDIEDLCQLVSSPSALPTLEKQFPVLVKKGRRILRLPQNKLNRREPAMASPTLDAVKTKTVQV